jgi:orotate phosphoribosyltransferase
MDLRETLKRAKAVAEGHFVYKALYMHGQGHIDKDQFSFLGANDLIEILEAEAEKALNMGLELDKYKEVVLLTPAYGAIKLGLPIAAYLEKRTGTKIYVIETEVERDEKGLRYHIIPDNQKKRIIGLPVFGEEDIVNNGKTLIELNKLSISQLGSEMFAALAIIDRGGQTTKSLGISKYYPYWRIDMTQHDVRNGICPLCAAGVPINTDLGKGAGWVKMFGQPPYPPDMDFSAFWAEK